MARPITLEVRLVDDSGFNRSRRWVAQPGVTIDVAKVVPVGEWIVAAVAEIDAQGGTDGGDL